MIKKLYIIDDDEISVYLTSLVFETADLALEIHAFFNADDAFAELLQLDYDAMPEIIMLDLNMPDKSGWDFLDMLTSCETELRNRTNIFILTSSIAECDKIRSESYPLVKGFLHKPLDDESLAFIKRMYINQSL